MSYNKIAVDGAQHISEALQHNIVNFHILRHSSLNPLFFYFIGTYRTRSLCQ